jgi:transcriptional regulator with GAF, ATPase, and Fis domain
MNEPNTMPDVLERQNKKLSILYEIALTVGKSLDLKTILSEVLEKVIAFMGVDAGVIYVIDDETLEMIPITFRNISEAVVKDLCERKVKVGECMCGSIAECDREVIILEKASLDPRFTRGVLKKENMEFYAGLPLKARNKVVGVLCVISHAPYAPEHDLLDILRAATQPIGLAIENARMFEHTRRETDARIRYSNFAGIITGSAKMTSILELVRKITDVPSSILIYGESGTGKELIAKALHFNSIRKDRPFIAVNCAALNENLLEAELFGYVKGAFTGAAGDRIGLFEAADNGTLFLDEVEAMSKNLQVKLLRVLQDSTFFPVGSTRPTTVNVRIIAATNQHLEDTIKTKQFREDLYYRLNVIRIDLPPLRERPEDIPLLARYFLAKFSKRMEKDIRRISDEAMQALLNYAWPGNIRELENALERAVVVAETDEIRTGDLPLTMGTQAADLQRDWSLERVKQEHIAKVLDLVGGNKKKAAKLLGLDTTTLWRIAKAIDGQ